ncbi:MAG: hypothetical protein GY804_13860 [Alphaproteobacteria bacterium]|nr:hypothetical protein [Alphaproteobacteria bacterium]
MAKDSEGIEYTEKDRTVVWTVCSRKGTGPRSPLSQRDGQSSVLRSAEEIAASKDSQPYTSAQHT